MHRVCTSQKGDICIFIFEHTQHLRCIDEVVDRGIIDADYGGFVIKQRIARPNEGKSGGYRSIVFFCKGERAFFIYGFAKNAQDNIDESDERDFKELAKTLLACSDVELEKLVSNGLYEEVIFDEEN